MVSHAFILSKVDYHLATTWLCLNIESNRRIRIKVFLTARFILKDPKLLRAGSLCEDGEETLSTPDATMLCRKPNSKTNFIFPTSTGLITHQE